jgi:hypothetical protein
MSIGKLTIQRGNGFKLAGVVITAGTPEAQTDTMSLNIDTTNLKKGDALQMLEGIKQKIQASKWPVI